jgi:ABC-type multidrug transport system fused ATPase/permease subunit
MNKFLNYLRKTWKYIKDEKKWIIIYIIANVFSIVINIVVPILSAKQIIALTNNAYKQLFLVALVVLLIECLRNLVNRLVALSSRIIYKSSFIRIQEELSKEILKLKNESIDQNSSGVFIQRLTNDSSNLSQIFDNLIGYITELTTDVGIFVAVFIINKIAFLYLVIMMFIIYLIEKTRTNKRNEADKVLRKEKEKISGFIGEIVRGVRDIKMLNAEDSFIKELNTKIVNLNQMQYDRDNINTKYHFVRGCARDFGDFLLICLLIYLLMSNQLVVANALIIHNYSGRTTSISYLLGNMMDSIKEFNLSAERVFALMDNEEFPKEEFGKIHIDKVNGDFEFKHVYFSYKDNLVLKDLSFKIKANETVAFVGKTGSGKTTIFNLLCKMYDINKGQITIDGYDIKTLDRETIRGNITIISQNPYIFNLSLRDNFRLVKDDITDKEMIDACKTACIHDFIVSLKDGYDTIVGEGGVMLSGGEKQRIAIARALIQKTEIILFDEATSSLDNETQREIQKAIDNMKKEYTILIIAHRLSTIINSNRILYLNNGHIECSGTHQQLLKNSNNYRKLYEAEIKKQNINN